MFCLHPPRDARFIRRFGHSDANGLADCFPELIVCLGGSWNRPNEPFQGVNLRRQENSGDLTRILVRVKITKMAKMERGYVEEKSQSFEVDEFNEIAG
jgi:hypothetical protein